MGPLPKHGYLSLPLRLAGGRLETCDLGESIRRFLQLSLNAPLQGRDRPAWLVADPEAGCRVPHYDFQAVADTLSSNTSRLVSAIKKTVGAVEPRVRGVTVRVESVPKGDSARRRPDESIFEGVMKRVTIRCERVDGGTQELHYDVAFGGSGPIFGEDD